MIRIPRSTLLVISITSRALASAPDEALIRGHRVQEERRLRTAPDTSISKPPTPSSGRREGSKQLSSTVEKHGGFLDRIPADVLARGEDLARDPERLKQALLDGPTLSLLLAIVPHTNADVQKAKRAWEATLRQYDQATYLEDLIAQYRAFVRELDPGVGPGGHRESSGKIFYFPSALSLRGELIRWSVERQRLLYLEALRHGLSLIAHDYQAAWFSARSVALLQESRDLFRDVETITQTQLQVGRVSQADSLKAQSAIAVLEARLVAMAQEGSAARARINAWLGVPAETPWGTLHEPSFDPDLPASTVLWERAQARRQELGQSRAAMETARTLVRLAETNLYPRGASTASTLSLGTGAEAGPGRDGEATFSPGPRPGTGAASFGAQSAWIDELRLRAKEAEAAYEAEKSRTLRGLTDTLARLQGSAVLRKAYRETAVPLTHLSVETLRSRYIGGQTPFIEFLDAARTALEFSMEELKATRENWNDMVDLMEWLGGTIAEKLSRSDQGM